MARYRKKPLKVEAIQYHGSEDYDEFVGWFKLHQGEEQAAESLNILADIKPGTYIIRGVDNEFYPVGKDVFLQTYSKVD